MPTFIKLSKKDRIKLFNLARANSNISFNKIYPQFNISRSMFYHYLSGKYDIPKNIFLELQNISETKIEDYEEIEKDKYLLKEIIKPILNSSFAETIGILNGDGHIAPLNHEICVVISHMEEDYFGYLKDLFEETFNLSFKRYQQGTRLKLRTNSKKMADHLHNEYNLPKGNKMGKLKIPKQILNSKELLIAYLRGLYDTDGTFYLRRKKDPVVEISSADPRFLKEIQESLISLNFNVGRGKNRVYIYDKTHINDFFKLIKPANPKHLKKHQNYLKLIAPLV